MLLFFVVLYIDVAEYMTLLQYLLLSLLMHFAYTFFHIPVSYMLGIQSTSFPGIPEQNK